MLKHCKLYFIAYFLIYNSTSKILYMNIGFTGIYLPQA